MLRIRSVIKNKNNRGLLLDPMTDETAMNILRRKQQQKTPDKPIEEIAEAMVPRDDTGHMALPIRYLFGTLKAGGRHVSFKGKANITASSGETRLYSFLEIEEEESGFVRLHDGNLSTEPKWQPLVRVTRNDQDQAVVKVCPIVKEWRAQFHLLVNDDVEGVSERMVRELVEKAGLHAGLGCGRPQKGGGNGQFVIEEWEVLEDGNGKTAKPKRKAKA